MSNTKLELVKYPSVKQHLENAQTALYTGNEDESLNHSARAFAELTYAYESNKRSSFHVSSRMPFLTSFHMGVTDRKMADFVDEINKSVSAIQKVARINSLGIDYPSFLKFQFLTPHAIRTMGGVQLQENSNKKVTTTNCQYCIDFVVENALRLQEVDFSL